MRRFTEDSFARFPFSCCFLSHRTQRVVDAPPLSSMAARVRDARMHSTMLDFVLCLALNHTVVLETDPKTGLKQMQAESPDEEALVDGAKVRPGKRERFILLPCQQRWVPPPCALSGNITTAIGRAIFFFSIRCRRFTCRLSEVSIT